MDLQGQRVLVTGGGSGIGLGIAAALAQEGCRVAITGRREERLKNAVASIESKHPVQWRSTDTADREQVSHLFDWLRELGLLPLDILVYSAGMNIVNRSMSNVSPEDFDRVMAVNATGLFNCLYAALPGMREQKNGLIINISSVAGRRIFPLAGLPYSASKYAASAIGTFVGQEEAANGIRVTNIYPGEANTPLLDDRPVPPPADKRVLMLQPEDLGAMAVAIAKLPPRAVVSEMVITPPYMIQS